MASRQPKHERFARPCEFASVLVASSDPDLRRQICQAIERDGYHLGETTNGTGCIEVCLQHPPDLILLDANMPDMSGLEVCEVLRKNSCEAAVFLVTHGADDASVHNAFSHGVDDLIPHPIHWAVLRQRVARLVNNLQTTEEITRIAYHDALTGLPNRQLFLDRCGTSLARVRRSGEPVALMFVDLNRFKQINDTLGHQIGDDVLRQAADRLVGAIREGDTVARLGGDEFVVLLEGIRATSSVASVADKILAQFDRPFTIDALSLRVSASIGISMFPDDGEDITTLLANADTAMYRAKREGKNDYQFFAQEMRATRLRRLLLGSNLHRALARNEMQLYSQPRMHIAANGLQEQTGIEILLRWDHPQLGMIPPAEFIPLAEEMGLIAPIGDWILREACQRAADWQSAGTPVLITVNLSALQLRQRDLLAMVETTLNDSGLDPGLLELELNEKALLQEDSGVHDILWKLNELGVRLSLDNFGIEPCSLTQLRRLPIATMTMDRSLIAALPGDSDAVAIARAAIATANCLGQKLIAKGVENQEQVDFLRAEHCFDIQGYFCGKPSPLAAA